MHDKTVEQVENLVDTVFQLLQEKCSHPEILQYLKKFIFFNFAYNGTQEQIDNLSRYISVIKKINHA